MNARTYRRGMGRSHTAGRARVALAFALLIGTLAARVPWAGAEDLAEVDPVAAVELAEKYAPIMMLKAQEAACDQNGEPYGPTSADILLDNPEIVLRQLGPGNPVIKVGPDGLGPLRSGAGFLPRLPGWRTGTGVHL